MALLDRLRQKRSWYYYAPGYGVQVANLDAASLYRTQPNLRAAISFLADNAAQVPLKVHDRVSDDDRPRVLDSPAALLLAHPNDDMTAYELKRATYSDLYLYGRCIWLVVPDADAASGWQVRHIPATWVVGYEGDWAFSPDSIVLSADGSMALKIPRDKFVLFHGYDPTDPMRGSAPIEALKDVLYEQVESNRFRRQMWQRGGRFNTYISRPKDVEPWSNEAFERFKTTWRNSWAGDGEDAGGTPILEDGMTIGQVQFNSKDAEWAESKRLTREDVAGVYHFNPALLWPGSGQTYASAKDNARALYNDTLSPMLMQVTNRIDHQLLPMIGENPRHYVAYDITIKTEGSFEEKLAALVAATGGPFLTRDEARAKLDLPALGANELIVPLNVIEGVGGQSIDNGADMLSAEPQVKDAPRRYKAAPLSDEEEELAGVYRRFFKRQRDAVLPKLGAKAEGWWDAERWDRELAADLFPVALRQATRHAKATLRSTGIRDTYSEARTEAYVQAMSEGRARMVNAKTKDDLDAVTDWEGDPDAEHATYAGVFDIAEGDRADTAGAAYAAAAAGFGALEAVRQCAPYSGATKTWVVTSGNPRPSHAAMDGETVPYRSEFSNGAQWPGDSALDAADVANCQCVVEITVP